MAKVLKKADLPHFDSTRDGRDRLDLIKNGIPADTDRLMADRVLYHPDDTCAKHYHVGAYHLFVLLYGEATVCTPVSTDTFQPGEVVVIRPDEVHWFENHSGENYSFVEFWAPVPEDTVWIVEDDI